MNLSLSLSLSRLTQVGVTSRSSVPSFTPDLRKIPLMPHCKQLQYALLSKIVNAERASYHAPKFLKLTVRYLQINTHAHTIDTCICCVWTPMVSDVIVLISRGILVFEVFLGRMVLLY